MGFIVNETNIIYAIIGMVGLFSTLAVVSRSFAANGRYEKQLKKPPVCEVCAAQPCECK